MNRTEATQKWLTDGTADLVPGRDAENVIGWLGQQTPDDWHAVATSWNYDWGTSVLTWLLERGDCDQGTAAKVFMVEAEGHWFYNMLTNEPSARDPNHLCNRVLNSWGRYTSSELNHRHNVNERMRNAVEQLLTPVLNEEGEEENEFENLPLQDIMAYSGKRDATSNYVCGSDGIRMTFEYWLEINGIVLTDG